ncbi:HD domain-containing protein [Oxalobacteraceae bacterium OM1]|nr:HD domain-containing protein [Oxalobacteraceae bacterium OM1]
MPAVSRLARVLIVAEPDPAAALAAMLRPEGYAVDVVRTAAQAAQAIPAAQPDLMLVQASLRGMNGFQLTRQLKATEETASIPVILLLDGDSRESALLANSAGAEDTLVLPVDRFDLALRVRNLVRLRRHSNALPNHKRFLEQQVRDYASTLRDSHLETIAALARASRFKDEETGAHVRRISHYSAHLASVLGMDAAFVDTIFHASPMHDIGKIGVPDEILLKPGAHTPEETVLMRRHTIIGAAILGKSSSPYLAMAADIALRHHERWDGSGYPDGQAGEAIPLAARIMAICDVYDALRSRRPYKEPFSHDIALRAITIGDGRTSPTHFDPAVLAAFTGSTDDFLAIFEEYKDDDGEPRQAAPGGPRRH